MSEVHGEMKISVSVKVDSDDETMGLLEANYRINPERLISYRLTAIDCKGKEHIIKLNDVIEMNLNEFIG
jgi:hypothetical protein